LRSRKYQRILLGFWENNRGFALNADLTRKALEKVGNPNVLVNLVSRRVRQLNGVSGGAPARPLISETAGLGAADIALIEIAEDKLGWEMLDQIEAEAGETEQAAA
jgi:DNA-directed RNA polymerase subunit K/omega